MSAELIKANDGVTLYGARVSWTYAHDYRDCNVGTLSVKFEISYPDWSSKYYVDSTFSDNSVELINLDCNSGYRFVIIYGQIFSSHQYLGRTSLFYGGKYYSYYQ